MLNNTNKYQYLISAPGLFAKIITCAGVIASKSGHNELASVLLRTDDGYPERLLGDPDYLIHQVVFYLKQHAEIIGSRICQDWSGKECNSLEYTLSPEERDVISYVYQQNNSELKDYSKEKDFLGDEMVASFSLAEAVRVIALYHTRLKNKVDLSLLDAVNFAIAVLPNNLNSDLDVFNFCIKQIQNAIGQPNGDNAGMFFSNDVFFRKWEIQNQEERRAALIEYCVYELDFCK